MIGDRVKVGIGTIDVSPENVPIYDVHTAPDGSIVFDDQGVVSVRVVGGVKGGSLGTIAGQSVRVLKTQLKKYHDGTVAMGVEYVMLYPVEFDLYKKVAWAPQDHVHVIG